MSTKISTEVPASPCLCGGMRGCFCDASSAAAADFRAVGVLVTRRAGQLLLTEGGPAGDLYLLHAGIVKLFHSAPSGRGHILRIVGPGTILGELSIHGTRTLSVSVEAVTDVRLFHLSGRRIRWLVERQPALALHLLEALSSELSYARQKTRDLALKDATSRLASLLLVLSKPAAGDGSAALPMRYRRADLAAMIGVGTETIIRALASLRARRIVASRGRDLAIIDRARLRRLAFGDAIDEAPPATRPAPTGGGRMVRAHPVLYGLKVAG